VFRIRASKDQFGPSAIGANQLSPQFRASILFSVTAKRVYYNKPDTQEFELRSVLIKGSYIGRNLSMK